MDVVIRNPGMSREQLSVKFCPESDTCQVPTQTIEGSAGYDPYPAKAKTILPKDLGIVSLKVRWKIPKGFYGKISSRPRPLVKNMITAEGGVIDSDYRVIVKVLLMNHHRVKPFEIKIGDRVAQVVFMKKYDVNFEQISYPELLGETANGTNMHVSVIKKKEGVVDLV